MLSLVEVYESDSLMGCRLKKHLRYSGYLNSCESSVLFEDKCALNIVYWSWRATSMCAFINIKMVAL